MTLPTFQMARVKSAQKTYYRKGLKLWWRKVEIGEEGWRDVKKDGKKEKRIKKFRRLENGIPKLGVVPGGGGW